MSDLDLGSHYNKLNVLPQELGTGLFGQAVL